MLSFKICDLQSKAKCMTSTMLFEYYSMTIGTWMCNTGLHYCLPVGIHLLLEISFYKILLPFVGFSLLGVINAVSNCIYMQGKKMRHSIPLTFRFVASVREMFLSNLICYCFIYFEQIDSSFKLLKYSLGYSCLICEFHGKGKTLNLFKRNKQI